jgi:hypothetical protein
MTTLTNVAAGAAALGAAPLVDSLTASPGAPAATPTLCRCGAISQIRYTWGQSRTETPYCGPCALVGLSWEPALRFALTYGMGASA